LCQRSNDAGAARCGHAFFDDKTKEKTSQAVRKHCFRPPICAQGGFAFNRKALPFDLKKLSSLWGVIYIYGTKIWALMFSLDSFYAAAQQAVTAKGPGCILPDNLRKDVLRALDEWESDCQQILLDKSVSRIAHMKTSLIPSSMLCTVFASDIHGLRIEIMNEAAKLQFVFIPPDRAVFFEKEALFGQTVLDAFPSAGPEIKDAGNCLVLELHTAAVFHFMRASEYGLRALARHLKVKVKSSLEYADWGTILKAIQKKLDAIAPLARTKNKAELLEFYGRMLSDCNMLKDTWRNSVMHARARYTESEALGVYTRVSDFMEQLSTKVKE
jgi:hypothetical protein